MTKVTVIVSLTLDGVMQSPGRPDEDTREGFPHGGWARPYAEDSMGRLMGRDGNASLLLGRRTYEAMYEFWPNQPANRYTDALEKQQKYVASTTATEPLPWQNSTLVTDAVSAVTDLREHGDKNLIVLGSGELVRSLREHNLVDEYILLVHPLVLGTGRKLFADGDHDTLRLVDSVATTTGVLIGTYEPEDQ